MNISNCKLFHHMSYEERLSLILAVRESRKIRKTQIDTDGLLTRKPTKTRASSAEKKVTRKITKEQAAALLKELRSMQ